MQPQPSPPAYGQPAQYQAAPTSPQFYQPAPPQYYQPQVAAPVAYPVATASGYGRKSVGVAYLFWLIGFFGVFGFHRFYIGKIGTGLLWFLTGGIFFIGAFIDLFTLGTQVSAVNANRELGQIRAATNAMAQANLR